MTLVLNGTNGLSDVDGSAATPAIRGTDANTGIFFPAADTIAFSEGGAEVMRIDSSGNVGIGTSSPLSVFDVVVGASGARRLLVNYDDTTITVKGANNTAAPETLRLVADNIRFNTGTTGSGTERARIDSSGNLLVGTTSAGGSKFIVRSTGLAGAFYVTAASTTATEGIQIVKFDNVSTTSQVFQKFYINDGGAACGQINANGANTAAFGSTSDSRLKENIADLPSQLSNIMALRTVEFDYIESEGGGHQIGFIAQEVQEIYPDLVGERTDGMLTLTDLNKNDARLIKAIQEMKAIIDAQASTITTLTDRITALEAKP
jgi:hypothetical protein